MPNCGLCGLPMGPNEEMFKFHGYSGPCPGPPLPTPAAPEGAIEAEYVAAAVALAEAQYEWENCSCGLSCPHAQIATDAMIRFAAARAARGKS